MLALNADGVLAEVAQAMGSLAQQVTTAEITIATRSVEIDGVAVEEGNVIGLLDGKLRAAGEDVETVLAHLLAAVEDLEERELVTLFYGADVSEEDAAEVAEQITTAYPELEVEVQAGGQPYYFYILGIE
jgi:dihydroxyacetone kinase-like predicted kinase